jgi:hypothetical protein
MLRRVVTLLLLPCLLLSQSAAIGHAHGGSLPAGHDLRPHVHASFAVSTHDAHGHHDGHGCHHHHGEAVGHDADPVTAVAQEHPVPHDHDAVYLPAESTVAPRERLQNDFDFSAWLVTIALVIGCDFYAADPPLQARASAAERAPARPLYIRHLALLI